MALVLNLKYLEGLDGLSDRLVKASFRGSVQQSQITRGKDSIYFGEQFEWPIGRAIESTDTIEISVYNFSKFLQNKFLGSLTIGLQGLIESGNLSLTENLADQNYSIINTVVIFDLTYFSPDSTVGDWRSKGQLDEDAGTENGELESNVSEQDLYGQNREDESDYDEADEPLEPSMSMKKSLEKAMLDATMEKLDDFQVSVTVIECKQLSGANINPCIEVRVGDKVKRTEIKMSTNEPYYNQYMCFDFRMSKAELLDQVILIKAMAMGNMAISRLLSGSLIGEFRMDVRNVYEAPDHTFSQKWAMLMDPKDVTTGCKGYVKVNVSVVGKGEPVSSKTKTVVKKSNDNEEEDIEANLLIPHSIRSAKRQMAEISVKIYRAEDLPRMNTDIMASIKQAITGNVKPMVDPFVQVSFAGHTGKTKSKRHTYAPEWNEEVIFTEMFPPLCNRIRVSVFDWDAVYNEIIATHFIELNLVMNEGENGFLPTLGPSWVNLYGTPRNYTYHQMMHPKEDLNRGLGEGVAYRGRLLMALKTTIKHDTFGVQSGVRVCGTHPVSEFVAGKREEYFLCGALFEASAIDQDIGCLNKPITFELSIGTMGNQLDGQFVDNDDADSDSEDEADAPKGVAKDKSGWCQGVTPHYMLETQDSQYYHIPFNERKPILFMQCKYEDHRPRMYIPNIIEKLRDSMNKEIESIGELIQEERKGVHQRMRNLLKRLFDDLEATQNAIKSCRGTAAKTLLDKERHKLIRTTLEKMKVKTKNMRKDCSMKNVHRRLKECKALVKVVSEIIEEPQHSLPDVFIWMLMDKKRIAFARLPARSILYSIVDHEVGKDSGKVVTIFLRKPGRKGMGRGGWALQGQLKMYLWLGLFKDMSFYKQGLPEGFDEKLFKGKMPPKEIVYKEKSYFQFRAHMFMARNLIGSDDTGLSDAFARVILNDYVVTTRVINATLSPTWDETLIVETITFYLNRELIQSDPPLAIVELFDEDTNMMGGKEEKSEFLGRCFCKPLVVLDGQEYRPPILEWWDIYRGQQLGGDLLAAFELIQVCPESNNRVANGAPSIDILKQVGGRMPTPLVPQISFQQREDEEEVDVDIGDEGDVPLVSSEVVSHRLDPVQQKSYIIVSVPKEIRPRLDTYRVEILFWGVREMQRVQLQIVERPKITVDFGGSHLYSEAILQASTKPNFSQPVKYINLELPENEFYWPPLMLQCQDFRQFGRVILVGTHVISSVAKYIIGDKTPKKKEEKKKISHELLPVTLEVPHDTSTGLDNLAFTTDTFEDVTSPMTTKLVDLDATSMKSAKSAKSLKSTTDKKSRAVSFQDLLDVKPEVQKDTKSLMDHPGAPHDLSEMKPNGIAAQQTPPVDKTKPPATTMDAVSLHSGAASKAGATVEIKKRPKIPKKDMEDVDWWTKFYVSIEDFQKNEAVKYAEGEMESDLATDILADIDVNLKADKNEDNNVIDIPDAIEDEKTRKKRKKLAKKAKKAAMKKRLAEIKKRIPLPFRKKDAAKEFLKEKGDEDIVFEGSIHEDNSWIERLKVLPCPLEECKEFGRFEEFLDTFSLYRGKQEDEDDLEENRIIGTFKGKISIYRIQEHEFEEEIDPKKLILYKDLPSNDPINILLRVYIIRAHDLHPTDPNGKSDPYLVLKLGNNIVVNDKENYIPKQLNPVFGKCFELDALIPQDSILTLSVMDWDLIGSDDLIGTTKIDLENRYYSRHRPLCGLAKNFDSHGYNRWRDSNLPTQILEKLCKDIHIPPPKYETLFNKVTVNGVAFYAIVEIEDESGELKQSNEPLALEVLKNWETVPGGCRLVSEHIETRPLFNPEKPGIEQGRVEMWIDMFPRELGVPPVAVDVSPRVPATYQLRVTIWNTEDVILADDSMMTGEKSSDIFVKGWMKGLGIDDQVTDVHYRSMSGEGNFNWRFIFDFDYLKSEDKIIFHVKDSPFSIDETEIKAPCKLYLQVWDADLVSSDDFLGGLELFLTRIPRGAKSSMACGLHQLAKDGSVPTLSIFRNKRCRGWWPFVAASEDDPQEMEVTGKVDAEFILMTPNEVETNLAGYGREEPNALPPPNRPDSSFLSFMNPLKSLKYLLCKKFRNFIIKLLIVGAFVALIVLFVYNAPGYLAKRMMGA